MQQQPVTDGDGVKAPEHPSDFPPESFCLSKDSEFEWFDRNAFFERKESTKLTSNAFIRNSPNNTPVTPNYSASKTRGASSIIGFLNCKSRSAKAANRKDKKDCPNGKMRLFAGETDSNPDVIEPPSPKVSCTGRVRRTNGEAGRSELGLFAIFQGMVRLGCRGRNSLEVNGPFEETEAPSSHGSGCVSKKRLGEGEPPELGGLERFSSRRRPDVHG